MKAGNKMKEWIYLGKIVNTHGIKGEIRILSDFEKKNLVFKTGMPIYIGKEHRKEIIKTYRPHKTFDMVCYENVENINEVLKDIGKYVYLKREEINLKENEYFLEELIGFQIIENEKNLGIVEDIVYNKSGILLEIKQKEKKYYIPKNDYFIKKVNGYEKTILVENTQGLI